jgi:hypothetical protein
MKPDTISRHCYHSSPSFCSLFPWSGRCPTPLACAERAIYTKRRHDYGCNFIVDHYDYRGMRFSIHYGDAAEGTGRAGKRSSEKKHINHSIRDHLAKGLLRDVNSAFLPLHSIIFRLACERDKTHFYSLEPEKYCLIICQ